MHDRAGPAPSPGTSSTTAPRRPTRPNGGDSYSSDAGGGDQDGDPATDHKEDQHKGGWRTKLPGLFAGPVNALFPTFTPTALYDEAPPFVAAANRRAAWRNRKVLFRTLVVFMGGFILMLEPVSLRVLGQASFFAGIVTVMLPPMFPVQMFLLAATMLVVGQCLGWAWGCAAMAASLRARNQVLLLSQVQRAQAGIAGATNPDAEYRRKIFQGAFLEWRSTLTHGCFFAVGLFALGLIRVKAPKLMLLSIFGSIVLDIMCSYGPLFPVQQYTLATTFLIPTGCYLALAVTGTIFIFPQTLNYSWTSDLVDKFLSPVLQRSHLHSRLLHTAPPSPDPSAGSAPSPWSPFTPSVLATQEAMSTALEGLLDGIPMLELESSYGRLGAKDLKGLADALREVHVRSVGLAVLFTTVQSKYEHRVQLASTHENAHPSSGSAPPRPSKTHHHAQSLSLEKPITETARMHVTRSRLLIAERTNAHDLASLLPLFAGASHDLRAAGDRALEGGMGWLVAQNEGRWGVFARRRAGKGELEGEGEGGKLAALQREVDVLGRELKTYRTSHRAALVAPFQDFFDPSTGELLSHRHDGDRDGRLFAPGSLFTLLAASDNLVTYSVAVLAFTRQLVELGNRRRKNHLWLPTGLRKIGRLVMGGGGGKGTGAAMGDGENPDRIEQVGDEEDEEDEDAREVAKLRKRGRRKNKTDKTRFETAMQTSIADPEARPPKNALQRGALGLYRFLHWWTSPDVLFALKYVAGSIAIWLFQVFPSTAYLSYSQKALWTLITFQTFLAPHSGDQILSTVQRVLGTAVGLVYGMLIWYVGSANGSGTRAGVGAALFVLMVPWFAVRLYAPPASAMFGIMAAVTSVLIVGYSWQDTHLPSVGNPGVGYNVAWRRALLVIIGAGIAAVFMLIPPQSSRRLVRRTHATCVQELGRLYTAIVSEWLSEERYGVEEGEEEGEGRKGEREEPFSKAARQVGRARMLALRVKLNSSRIVIEQAAFELSLRGDWPKENYHRLLTLQLALLQSLSQLGQALVRLDHDWRSRLVHETAFLNQPLIADVTTTFTLISLALREGAPLPEATPGPLLDRLLQHDRRLRLFSEGGLPPSPTAAEPASVEGARVGSFILTLEVLKDERFGTQIQEQLNEGNMEDKVGSARKKAPSRQAHACPVCHVVYSRAEFVRRHFLSKHAPKPLACGHCDATFSRRDLLQRHVKLFHPDSELPTLADTASEPDIPAPVPVPSRSTSAASYASSASDVTGGATGAIFGNWISSSPEPMAGGATLPDDMRLPTPPPPLGGGQPSTSSSNRTATYPPPRPTYQPYRPPTLPALSVPPTPVLPRGYPTSSHSSFSTATSSLPPVPYRAYTAPAGYDSAAALQLAGMSAEAGPSRQASYSDASVQTDLRAQQIPPVPVPAAAYPLSPPQGGQGVSLPDPPMGDDALAALLQRLAPNPPPAQLGMHPQLGYATLQAYGLDAAAMGYAPLHAHQLAQQQHGQAPHHSSLLGNPPWG